MDSWLKQNSMLEQHTVVIQCELQILCQTFISWNDSISHPFSYLLWGRADYDEAIQAQVKGLLSL